MRKKTTPQRRCIHRRSGLKRKRARRLFIGLILILLAVILLSGAKRLEVARYEYTTGTSLWGMAEEYCPGSMDKREYISEIMALNSMTDGTVYAGRVYQVPIYEK